MDETAYQAINEEHRMAVLEQIAMYMTALPCPPLPLRVCKITGAKADDDEDEKYYYGSSHDNLARLLLAAMRRGRCDLNEERRLKQTEVTLALVRTLDKEPQPQTPDDARRFQERALTAYQRFTADYIAAFEDPGTPTPAVEFLDPARVERGHKVHHTCASYMAAQDILHESDVTKRRTAEALMAQYSYAELLAEHAQRMCAKPFFNPHPPPPPPPPAAAPQP